MLCVSSWPPVVALGVVVAAVAVAAVAVASLLQEEVMSGVREWGGGGGRGEEGKRSGEGQGSGGKGRGDKNGAEDGIHVREEEMKKGV